MDSEKRYKFFNKMIECKKCNLSETRKFVVGGIGRIDSKVMLLMDSPDKNANDTGLPFAGDKGVFIKDSLGSIGLVRKKMYTTCIVKCMCIKPVTDEQKEACSYWLKGELNFIKPNLFITIGINSSSWLVDFLTSKKLNIDSINNSKSFYKVHIGGETKSLIFNMVDPIGVENEKKFDAELIILEQIVEMFKGILL